MTARSSIPKLRLIELYPFWLFLVNYWPTLKYPILLCDIYYAKNKIFLQLNPYYHRPAKSNAFHIFSLFCKDRFTIAHAYLLRHLYPGYRIQLPTLYYIHACRKMPTLSSQMHYGVTDYNP